jgi:hypothetical protein
VTTRERLAIAAAASLALHVLVMSNTSIPLPQPPGEPRPLQASLALLPVLKPAAPKPRAQAPRPVPPVPVLAAASPVVVPEFEPEADPAEEVAPVPAAPEPPQQLALAAETSLAAALPHSLPRRGHISYNLLYGNDRHYVGKVVASWEVLDDSYILTSDGATGGIVELFRPQRLRYLSRGKITARGLQPESFLASRTRRGENETADARFDWSSGSLTFGYARERRNVVLPAGAQDLMSFIYQFALLPPVPGRYRVPITTGTRFAVYDIEVSAEQSIETPLGSVRALAVRQLPSAGDESVEIWLAVEYRYLPVRIRHYDREGNFSGEQVVSEIRISEE